MHSDRCAGKLVCRYLLRRCDNEPAPWSASNIGDGPWTEDLPADAYTELEADDAIDVVRVGSDGSEFEQPHWAYKDSSWGWARPAPELAAKKPKNALTVLQKQKRTVRSPIYLAAVIISPSEYLAITVLPAVFHQEDGVDLIQLQTGHCRRGLASLECAQTCIAIDLDIEFALTSTVLALSRLSSFLKLWSLRSVPVA